MNGNTVSLKKVKMPSVAGSIFSLTNFLILSKLFIITLNTLTPTIPRASLASFMRKEGVLIGPPISLSFSFNLPVAPNFFRRACSSLFFSSLSPLAAAFNRFLSSLSALASSLPACRTKVLAFIASAIAEARKSLAAMSSPSIFAISASSRFILLDSLACCAATSNWSDSFRNDFIFSSESFTCSASSASCRSLSCLLSAMSVPFYLRCCSSCLCFSSSNHCSRRVT